MHLVIGCFTQCIRVQLTSARSLYRSYMTRPVRRIRVFLSAEAEPFELFENVLPHAEAKGRIEDDLVGSCMQATRYCAK